MTVQAVPIQKMFSRFFPRKYKSLAPRVAPDYTNLSKSEKKDLALSSLLRGEMDLLQGKLSALPLFETAAELMPDSPEVWYRQGLAFFEYGSEEGREKALLLASKHFKLATKLKNDFFEAWVAWGNTLLLLGRFHEEHHFHLEAKEKYQEALKFSKNQAPDVIAELHWDYGITWSEIAAHTGEALDIKLAIDAFQTSLDLQKNPSPEFLHDSGKAHLEMGLLTNDSRLYFQAARFLTESTKKAPAYFDGWNELAEVYSQLYINTMDEKYIQRASETFAKAVKLSPSNSETWLSWAQILFEAGENKNDARLLRQSIEHCARAYALDRYDTLIMAQWVESLSHLGALTSRLDLLVEAEQRIIKATDAFPDDPDLWHAYGVCMIAFGKHYEDADYFEMAIEKLQYGLSIDRSSAEHWHTLGKVHKLYADATNHEDLLQRAIRFYKKAIDLKPVCPSLLFDAAESLLSYSEIMHDLSSLQDALYYIEELLGAHKDVLLQHPEWLFCYAKSLEWLSEFSMEELHLKRAIDIFSQVLLIDPDFKNVHAHLAGCYMALGTHTCEAKHYKTAIPFFRLAIRQEEENDQILLDWGLTLIHLAHHTLDTEEMHNLYWEAEQKIAQSGLLGNTSAYYHLACLHSILGRTDVAMDFIHKSLYAKSLPTLDELFEDEWLENLRNTENFISFISDIEEKIEAREQ